MQIKMTVTLHLSADQMRAWANEYGLDADEVADDAREHLSALVYEHVKQIPHVGEFASLTDFTVK